MSRVIAVVACGFTVAACSASMPSLNFLSSSPPSEALRFESEPAGAEVKTSLGQTCRTPCELTVQVAPEMSATFALSGYQPQTISVRSEASGGLSAPRLAPNPVHVELRPVPVVPPAKKRVKKKLRLRQLMRIRRSCLRLLPRWLPCRRPCPRRPRRQKQRPPPTIPGGLHPRSNNGPLRSYTSQS